MSWEAVTQSEGLTEAGGGRLAKAWVFVALVSAFGGLIGSIWVLAHEALAPAWPGSFDPALKGFLQNAVCFAASLLFRASRLKSDA